MLQAFRIKKQNWLGTITATHFNVLLLWLPILGLIFFSLIPFLNHWFNGETFFGDSDRLNTFLNIRKFEVESLQQLKRVPAWNENIFMGFNTLGLHWMLPGLDPTAKILSYFPGKQLFWLSGCVTSLWYASAALAAYLYINDTIKSRFESFVAASLYVFSTFSLTRISQVDSAYWLFIFAPLGLLCLRRMLKEESISIKYFLFFTMIAIFSMFSFLQEAAYLFLLLGCYTIYKTIRDHSPKLLLLSGVAVLIAAIIAFPRIYTIFNEFAEFERTHEFHTTGIHEFFRWFYDGIYGRFPEELFSRGIGLNLHEGLQIYTATMVIFVYLWGLQRISGRLENTFSALFFISMSAIFWDWITHSKKAIMIYSIIVFFTIFIQCCLRKKRNSNKLLILSNDKDIPFHIFFFTLCLSVIFLPFLRHLLYLLFLKIDFTHSRLSSVALLSLMTLTAYFLKNSFGSLKENTVNPPVITLFITIAAGVLIAILLNKPLIDPNFYSNALTNFFKNVHISEIKLVPQALVHISTVFFIFIVFSLLLPYLKNQKSQKITIYKMLPLLLLAMLMKVLGTNLFILISLFSFALYLLTLHKTIMTRCIPLFLGTLMIGEGLQYATFQLSGPHTHTYPIPFGNNNFMTTKKDHSFRLPSIEAKQQIRRLLDVDNYRSILLTDPKMFHGFVSPHLALFWNLRLAEGYSAGVPKRLLELPWFEGSRNLRSLSFTKMQHINWELLSLLNVKYVLFTSPELYYNFSNKKGFEEISNEEIKVLENPFQPIPRVFFAKNIAVIKPDWKTPNIELPQKIILRVLDEKSILLEWTDHPWVASNRITIERKEGALDEFQIAGVSGPGGLFYNPDLKPGTEYSFRIKRCLQDHCSPYSKTFTIKTGILGIEKPSNLHFAQTGPEEIELTWDGVNPSRYTVIEFRRDPDGQYAEYATTVPSIHQFKVNGLKPYHGYHFRMRICESRGCSAHSEELEYYPSLNLANKIKSLSNETFITPSGITLPTNVLQTSLVEGLARIPSDLDNEGKITAAFHHDEIKITLTSSTKERFLVINELYHKDWHAYSGKNELKIYPTNLLMRGLVVPPGYTEVFLKFEPFIVGQLAYFISFTGMILLVLVLWLIISVEKRRNAIYATH